MTTSAEVGPSEPDWSEQGLDLDAIGLATEFSDYVRRKGIPPGDRQQALGAWLDEMIAGLEDDAEAD
ncbi:hypothetical protein E1212_13205 [Jiangella ureilytica]|uniref:Uncharacterized protein n=1 Tax=Jiangella ureilytica TaxID=2530374 RepID=A0A4R4RN61_9ACTN|nr:hypothetical protein [Jiangella ureilytica]TDC51100.1 hypothetical protein E1212_13205 [Jiangella ureilytica]